VATRTQKRGDVISLPESELRAAGADAEGHEIYRHFGDPVRPCERLSLPAVLHDNMGSPSTGSGQAFDFV
jgi:hypothetical protein